MREISLHLLDLIENAIRARATLVEITVEAIPETDTLRVVVADNGRGLSVPAEDAADPFYTTKSGKRTGLGLSLFRAAAELTGGGLQIGPSAHGGVAVTVTMGLTHVDRNPMGDLAGTLSAVVCTNPDIDFRFHLRWDGRRCDLRVGELAGSNGHGGLALARSVAARIKSELQGADSLT